MFWGECEFKTEMPPNVMRNGYITYIKSHTAIQFSDSDVQDFVKAIQTGMMPKGIIKSFQTRQTHLQSLDDRHSSTSVCPKCGSALTLRTAKSGQNAGNQFYGCSGFPACRFTKPA
jgi:predicted RNA-binding Zn-ribbon protein involved in translation (DUF1610 family)